MFGFFNQTSTKPIKYGKKREKQKPNQTDFFYWNIGFFLVFFVSWKLKLPYISVKDAPFFAIISLFQRCFCQLVVVVNFICYFFSQKYLNKSVKFLWYFFSQKSVTKLTKFFGYLFSQKSVTKSVIFHACSDVKHSWCRPIPYPSYDYATKSVTKRGKCKIGN